MMSKRVVIGAAVFGAAALGACEQAAEPPAPAMRLPEQVCKEAREGLAKLQSAGGFEYTDEGEATLGEAAWLPMSDSQKQGLAQALGIHAACMAKEPSRERTVVIRNEFGRALSTRVVETTADLSEIFK